VTDAAAAAKPLNWQRLYYISVWLILLGVLVASYTHARDKLEQFRFDATYATINRVAHAVQEFEDTHHRIPGKTAAAVAANDDAFWNDLDAAGLLQKYEIPASEKITAQGKTVSYLRTGFGDLLLIAQDGKLALRLASHNPNTPEIPPLTPQQARGLDQMLDDAKPDSGSVRGDGTPDCVTSEKRYNEAYARKACGLIIDLPAR